MDGPGTGTTGHVLCHVVRMSIGEPCGGLLTRSPAFARAGTVVQADVGKGR